MIQYQEAVKLAKAKYFSELIAKNAHSPKILFNIINNVLNPTSNFYPDPSPTACENFLKFFCEKIDVIRSCFPHSLLDLPQFTSPQILTNMAEFSPLSHSHLQHIFRQMKFTFCSLDVVHPHLMSDIFDFISPSLVSIMCQ